MCRQNWDGVQSGLILRKIAYVLRNQTRETETELSNTQNKSSNLKKGTMVRTL